MRFRNYLGDQYRNRDNIYLSDENGRKVKKACELISIYFLGHKLDNIQGVPVIKAPKIYLDVSNGKQIDKKENFLDSLNHESYTVVIPELKERRQSELEILLSVFDQSNITSNLHIINVKEDDFPSKYRDIIRRLQKAVSEPEIRDRMEAEDDIVEQLEERERLIFQKEIIIIEKDKVIEEKDKVIDEKEREIDEKDKEIEKLKLMLEKAKK